MSGGFLQVAGALAVTFGALGVALHFLRRWPGAHAAGGGAGGIALRVLRRVPLGPRHSLALVQVDDRVLAISIGDEGARVLTELGDGARARALAPPAGPDPARALPTLGEWLRRRGAPRGSAPALLAIALAATLACAGPVASARAAAPPAAAAPSLAPGSRVAGQTAAVLRGMDVAPPRAPRVDLRVGDGANALELSGAVGLVVFLGAMTLLPALFLLMTSFTRILIVLHFLRSALGTQNTPPNQLLVALAVLLTGVVMHPALEETNRTALQPYLQGRITQVEAYTEGVKPFRTFMLSNTREKDLATFARLAHVAEVDSVEALPIVVVVGAFVTSELRVSFQMGFVLFLPFLVVDLIVSSVLMSLGMFMLPPVMVSLPFKLLLFVLADGWTLVVQNLVASFR